MAPISSDVPRRRVGFSFSNLTNLGSFALAASSPGKVPGEMMLAVMPSGPNSAAKDYVRPHTACFATATGDAPG